KSTHICGKSTPAATERVDNFLQGSSGGAAPILDARNVRLCTCVRDPSFLGSAAHGRCDRLKRQSVRPHAQPAKRGNLTRIRGRCRLTVNGYALQPLVAISGHGCRSDGEESAAEAVAGAMYLPVGHDGGDL